MLRSTSISVRASRDERIAELDRRRWSSRQIAAEVRLSHVRVLEILARQRALQVALRGAEIDMIMAELSEIEDRMSIKEARRRGLRRRLVELREEEQSEGITALNSG